MDLNSFQIENLLINNLNFLLIDLRAIRDDSVEPKSLWQRAVAMNENEVLKKVGSLVTIQSSPILLLCEDGRKSERVFDELEAAGYVNVFVVEGGFERLRSDWEQSRSDNT